MRFIPIVFGMLLAGAGTIAAEPVYRWTDDQGVVHFSSQPPPAGVDAEQRSLEPMPMVGTIPPKVRSDTIEEDPELSPILRGQIERSKIAQKRMLATSYDEALRVECEQARSVINKLAPTANPLVSDSEGRVRMMSENERTERIRLAEEFLRDNC